ncbi:unknown [Prevotella sp. CAG:617]|nr:unknown [Prevotella sp. CAG:617]
MLGKEPVNLAALIIQPVAQQPHGQVHLNAIVFPVVAPVKIYIDIGSHAVSLLPVVGIFGIAQVDIFRQGILGGGQAVNVPILQSRLLQAVIRPVGRAILTPVAVFRSKPKSQFGKFQLIGIARIRMHVIAARRADGIALLRVAAVVSRRAEQFAVASLRIQAAHRKVQKVTPHLLQFPGSGSLCTGIQRIAFRMPALLQAADQVLPVKGRTAVKKQAVERFTHIMLCQLLLVAGPA